MRDFIDDLIAIFASGDELLANILNFINRLIEKAAFSALNLFVQVIPWTLSVVPAYMTFINVRWVLEFPETVPDQAKNMLAWASAINVEGIGIVSIFIAMSILAHNQRVKKQSLGIGLMKDRKVNDADLISVKVYFIPAFVLLFYVTVIVTINVLLQYAPNNTQAHIIAHIGLTVLTIPGALISSGWQFLAGRMGKFGTDSGQLGDISDNSDISRVDFRSFSNNLTDEQLLSMFACSTGPELSKHLRSTYKVDTSKPSRWLSHNIPQELEKRSLKVQSREEQDYDEPVRGERV